MKYIPGRSGYFWRSLCTEVTFLPLSTFPQTGIPTVAPPVVRPTPRPDVTPPSVGTFLLYAQGQQIGHLPLNGSRLQKDAARTLLSLHVNWVSPGGLGSTRRVGFGMRRVGFGMRLHLQACGPGGTELCGFQREMQCCAVQELLACMRLGFHLL